MKRAPKLPTSEEIRRTIAEATLLHDFESVARQIEPSSDREELTELLCARLREVQFNMPERLRTYAERLTEGAPIFEDAYKLFSLIESLARIERLGIVGASTQLNELVRHLKQRSREEPLFNRYRGQIYSDIPEWWTRVKLD